MFVTLNNINGVLQYDIVAKKRLETTLNMIFSVTMITFQMTLLMNKFANVNNVMDDGWVHSLAKTLPSLVNNLWWNIITNDWNLDEKPLSKWQ